MLPRKSFDDSSLAPNSVNLAGCDDFRTGPDLLDLCSLYRSSTHLGSKAIAEVDTAAALDSFGIPPTYRLSLMAK